MEGLKGNEQAPDCLINYYFLYIDQEFDLVYHHQTCQANWRKGRGKYRDPNKKGVDEQSGERRR